MQKSFLWIKEYEKLFKVCEWYVHLGCMNTEVFVDTMINWIFTLSEVDSKVIYSRVTLYNPIVMRNT